jgi:hypothetical protein
LSVLHDAQSVATAINGKLRAILSVASKSTLATSTLPTSIALPGAVGNFDPDHH